MANIDSSQKIVNIDDIFGFDDEKFVKEAFRRIFEREADIEGFLFFLDQIDRGTSRENIVNIMMSSEEGRTHNISIQGLKERIGEQNKKKNILKKWSDILFKSRNEIEAEISHLKRKSARLEKLVFCLEEKYNNICQKFERQSEILALMEIELASGKAELASEKVKLASEKAELAMLKETVTAETDFSKRIEGRVEQIEKLDMNVDFFKRLNLVCSYNPTVWGDEKKLRISPKAAVYACFFNVNSGCITVGDYSFAGSGVSLLAGSHDKNLFSFLRRNSEINEGCDIEIGKGVWLGSNCTVLGPANIGDNAIIAAGAVVAPGTVVPPNTIYGGVPAKKLRDIANDEKTMSEAVFKAVIRSNGFAFGEGWSEKKQEICEDENVKGHYILGKNAEVIATSGNYNLHYLYRGKDKITLSICENENCVFEESLSSAEGSINFSVMGENEQIHYLNFSISEGIGINELFISRKE